MDKIYSEMSDENDFTEGRKKRRISSILKAPPSPLRDLGSGNELTQDGNVEKRQRNSRRVSFAATISIFPSDPPTTEVSDHTGENFCSLLFWDYRGTATVKDQDTFNQNAELEVDLCNITGMNTLLHAPIRKPLQQLEDNVNTKQEWSKMDGTLLFSDENEMDMTSGHTIIINNATEICQDPVWPKRIAFKATSSALELKQEVIQMNDLSFISSPTKANESCLSQQKTNTGNAKKIKFDDFLTSLKSTKLFPSPIASEASERKVCPSKENVYTYLEGGNSKNTDIGRPANRQNYANVNEGGVNIKNASSDASVYCYQGTTPFSMPFGSVTSMPVLHGNTNRKSGVLNNAASLNSADKTSIFGFGEDMEITKPTYLIDNPINVAGFKDMPSQEMGIGKKGITLLDKTVLFSLSDDNEMEFTKSYTVAAKYNIQQCEKTSQVPSLQPLDKTVYHGNMDETKAITTIIDQPVKAAGVQAMQKQSELGSANVTEPACDKTLVFPLSEDNEMELTKSLTMAVEGALLAQSLIPAGSTNMPVFSSNMAISKSTAFPEDKTLMYMHNYDMEVTKPISHIMNTSREDTGFKPLQLKKKEMDKVIQSSSAKEETMCCLDKENEMTFMRSHTGSVNNDTIIPWANTQVLSSAPVDKNRMSTHSSDATISKSTTFAPANKTIMCNNSMEITKPISSAFLNRSFKSLPQQEMSNTTVPGSVTDNTVLALHVNEMEMTKCHTITVNVDNISQSENSPHIQFHQDNMNIAGSYAITKNPKRNSPWNVMKLEMDAGWEPSSDQIPTVMGGNDGHCEKNGFMFPVKMSAPYTKLHEETAVESNTERMCISTAECKSLKEDPRKLSRSRQVGSFAGETEAFPVDKITKKIDTVLCDWSNTAKDNNMDPPPINNVTSEEEPILLSKLSDVVSDCSKLNDNGKKSGLFLPSQDIGKELPEVAVKPADHLELREDVKKVSNIPTASNEWTNNDFTDVAPLSVPLNAMWNDSCKMKKPALGIFPPKLPNKRKPTISNVEYIGTRSEEKVETQGSKITQFLRRSLDKVTPNLSPSHYIDEELLPACVGEMDFEESLGCDVPEKLVNEKELADTEGCLLETSNNKKRAWNQDDEKLQREKKLKTDEGWNDTIELKQPLSSTMLAHEAQEGKNVTDLLATNMEKKQSSNSSSLDSVKADTDFSIQKNSEMEIPLLTNIICDQNLKEKLQDGTITVGQFFTLLQVDVIHTPHQSLLSPKHSVNTALAPEDEFLNEYVYSPKFQIYKEDCQALYKIIEELKLYAEYQHKPLMNVNKSLWGVMRTCSDEELKRFGEGLREMKSSFLKKSKVLAHKGKASLYRKLVQNGQLQWEKLQSRLAKVEELIKEMDSCLLALETETSALEESEPDVNDAMAEYKSKMRDTERELENYRAQEEALQREQSNIRDKKKQRASEISHLKEYAKRCQELMKKYNFSEWAIKEWNDHQAVFTFLYDSLELTLSLGCPVDGAVFSNRFCMNIVGVNLKSLLDEAKALPSSKLVHRLIFQFINGQSSLQEKCSTVHHLYQVLRDISLVVSRCELLGEEIEYLNRWGGKFNLLKTDVNDTKVTLLFSSSVSSAKFEVELSLSASYPASPIAFTIPKCTGNLNQEEISVVLSSVPVGANYLKRMVNQIHRNLLQGLQSKDSGGQNEQL
ncbi:kinetochore scaffold 1 [Lacerta agilis]|uniref:kinetochore scaffold 1 n=1 Tax=Lacerta agilis TaxID=80427 RepID=UPI0014197D9B|nr:kinetochore scaffold 1 [Lacerta agilis]